MVNGPVYLLTIMCSSIRFTESRGNRANLKVSQRKMKTWYDQMARQRIFKAGDNVLILLPVQGQLLQARY